MSQLIILRNLLSAAEPRQWQHFRPGIEAHVIYGHPGQGPAAALLKYQPGAHVPQHIHEGYEHILVLEGSQEDEQNVYETGTLYVSPPGTRHAVTSRAGCVVLAIWEKPVILVEPTRDSLPF